MSRLLLLASLIFGLATLARAEDERAGAFDYYILSLSWSPNWCVLEGDAKQSPQCDAAHDHGWILHGLWPQFHRGYPSFCSTAMRPPTRGMTAEMADIMGTSGLAWYQWRKHGACSGLSAPDYFALARFAFDKITKPAVFRALDRPVVLPASVVEEAFLKANPDITADGITITCRDGHIQEARICLSRDLAAVPCGRDVIRDCALDKAKFMPVR